MYARALAVSGVVIAAALAAACERHDTPQTRRALSYFPCPSSADAVAREDTLDTRMLVSEQVGTAAELARRFGCRLRVAVQDGRTIRDNDPSPRVVDVEIRRGRVARVIAVGEPDRQ